MKEFLLEFGAHKYSDLPLLGAEQTIHLPAEAHYSLETYFNEHDVEGEIWAVIYASVFDDYDNRQNTGYFLCLLGKGKEKIIERIRLCEEKYKFDANILNEGYICKWDRLLINPDFEQTQGWLKTLSQPYVKFASYRR